MGVFSIRSLKIAQKLAATHNFSTNTSFVDRFQDFAAGQWFFRKIKGKLSKEGIDLGTNEATK